MTYGCTRGGLAGDLSEEHPMWTVRFAQDYSATTVTVVGVHEAWW
jgi:hypothetical protein